MISDDEASAGLGFNYTAAQWAAITEQVNRGTTVPFDYEQLLKDVDVYFNDVLLSPSDQSNLWMKIADMAKQLRFLLADGMVEYADAYHQPFFDQVGKPLEELQARAESCGLDALGPTAKRKFYTSVLERWAEAGGQFRQSRAKPSDTGYGTPSGPTVLYFEAVVGPVMGKDAPGREAICKLIARQKRFEAEIQRQMDEDDGDGVQGPAHPPSDEPA